MPRRIVVLGNGPAGTAAAQAARQADPAALITVLSREDLPYYARPRLPEVVAGRLDPGKLVLYPPAWYAERRIELELGVLVEGFDPAARLVRTDRGDVPYDALVLATGADPSLPPVPGLELPGVHRLRTVEDALRLREAARGAREVVAIGGGLLGLELANAFADGDRRVTVIEIFPTLLSRQLDPERGHRLATLLEARGFRFLLGANVTRVSVEPPATPGGRGWLLLQTDTAGLVEADLVVVSAGMRPRTALAAAAGLACGRGIVVDQTMRTGDPAIWAAGDCVELDGKTWGFVKASMAQGKVAGTNAALADSGAAPDAYVDPPGDVTLKVTGVDLKTL